MDAPIPRATTAISTVSAPAPSHPQRVQAVTGLLVVLLLAVLVMVMRKR